MHSTSSILPPILLVFAATAAFAGLPSDCQDAIDADIDAGAVLYRSTSSADGTPIVRLVDASGDHETMIDHLCGLNSQRIRTATVQYSDLELADREFGQMRRELARRLGPPSIELEELTDYESETGFPLIQSTELDLINAAGWEMAEEKTGVAQLQQGEDSWLVSTFEVWPILFDSASNGSEKPTIESPEKVPSTNAVPSTKVDEPSTLPVADPEELERERAERIALVSAIPPDEMIWAYLHLAERDPGLMGLSTLERQSRRIENNRPVADRIRENGGLIPKHRPQSTNILAKLPARIVLEAMSWPEIRDVTIRKQHWDIFEPFWDTDTVGSIECPIVDGDCPAHCHGTSGSRFDNAGNCWSTENTLLVCTRGEGGVVAMLTGCNVNMSSGEFFLTTGGGPKEPYFLGWRECTKSEYNDRMSHATRCEPSGH